jgi:LPXTG-motif cell wall-anchored protein
MLTNKADGILQSILQNLDPANEGILTADDVIAYLIHELLAAGYSEKEIETLLTEWLGTEYRSAIKECLKDQTGASMALIIGAVAGLMALILIILWRRRKKE